MVGAEENKQKQGQMRVLRLRYAPLRMTHFMVGAEENKQNQGQMQVLRLRYAPLRMTHLCCELLIQDTR
jgi:hypothetical protein